MHAQLELHNLPVKLKNYSKLKHRNFHVPSLQSIDGGEFEINMTRVFTLQTSTAKYNFAICVGD